jgi:uncharacterized membrane protein YheB (UPF0754 family)
MDPKPTAHDEATILAETDAAAPGGAASGGDAPGTEAKPKRATPTRPAQPEQPTPPRSTAPVPPVLDPSAPADDGQDTSEVDSGPSVEEAKVITRRRVHDLRVMLGLYIRRHLPQREAKPKPEPAPPKMEGSYAKLLPVLQLIPWVLFALFVASFFWDFPGVVLSPFGYDLELAGLLRILAVSGLIGFFTNWLAITMLFNPREKRPIFGQGLIPAQRERVAYRLAKAVSDELINEDIIKAKIEESNVIPRYRELALGVARGVLEDDDFRRDLKTMTGDYAKRVLSAPAVRKRIAEVVVEKLEKSAGQGLGGAALQLYRRFDEEGFQRKIDGAIQEIPGSLDLVLDEMDALLDRVPPMLEAKGEDIEAFATRTIMNFVERIDVYSLVMENIQKYDEAQLENLLKRTSNEQLNYIKYLGGILGALGGLVIWKPILALAVFATVLLTLWGLDEALYRGMRKGGHAEG